MRATFMWFLVLIMAACLSAADEPAALSGIIEEAAARDERFWGPPVNGLAMLAWLEPESGAILGVIWNVSDEPITCNDYFLGYWERLRVEARLPGDEQWQTLRRTGIEQRPRTGFGPSPSGRRVLQPNAYMAPSTRWATPLRRLPPLALRMPLSFIEPLDVEWPQAWRHRVVECG